MNGQHSTWVNIEAGAPQGPILGPLFFLIYINDLSDDLTSNPKFWGDDTSLFSAVQSISSRATNLNSDWAFQWTISFNPEPNKQAQEVIFSRKINKIDHPPLLLIKI